MTYSKEKIFSIIRFGLLECRNAAERRGMFTAYAAEFGRETVAEAAQQLGSLREAEFKQAMRDKEGSLTDGGTK